MQVGAGTVLTAQQVDTARANGASFIVSPNTDADVIRRAVSLGMVSIPGALTPTEVVAAHNLGASFVKLFPGGDLGSGYLKAICAPISHIPILVVGGVNAENMQEFIKAGAAGFGIGSNIVDKKLIDSGAYTRLSELAKSYTGQFEALNT
jgi:2-dehydro-3-deoxyphosphogluconate aldolase/(4S)-4-hydroxy-2-oxoglutarate aldolase